MKVFQGERRLRTRRAERPDINDEVAEAVRERGVQVASLRLLPAYTCCVRVTSSRRLSEDFAALLRRCPTEWYYGTTTGTGARRTSARDMELGNGHSHCFHAAGQRGRGDPCVAESSARNVAARALPRLDRSETAAGSCRSWLLTTTLSPSATNDATRIVYEPPRDLEDPEVSSDHRTPR